MRYFFLLSILFILISCDEDEKDITNIDENPNPEDTIQTCNFNDFNVEYSYLATLDENFNNVNILANTKYENVDIEKVSFKITITNENVIDTIENTYITNVISACNSTGREFDLDNCRFTDNTDFVSTQVFCDNLDLYLLDRLTGDDLVSYNKDTIVVYEKDKDWYHYFISNKEDENIIDTLPKIKINSTDILKENDTLKIPLNINFLKNDSTDCFLNGLEVEPVYLDNKNSYVIIPNINYTGSYDAIHNINFISVTNKDTVIEIKNIKYFWKKWFNYAYFYVGNIVAEYHEISTSSHPQHGSNSSIDTSFYSSFEIFNSYDKFSPKNNNGSWYFPITINNNKNEELLSTIAIVSMLGNGMSGNQKEASIKNLNLEYELNSNRKEIIIEDIDFIKENLSLLYNDEKNNFDTSTKTTWNLKLAKVTFTDSSYIKIVLKRE